MRRHVVNPTSLSVWQMAATTWTAAKVNAIPQGIDWPLSPFVMQGTGDPSIYVMDEMPPAPTNGSDAGTNNNGGGNNGDNGGGSGGCNTAGSNGDAWGLALAALVLLSRKKR